MHALSFLSFSFSPVYFNLERLYEKKRERVTACLPVSAVDCGSSHFYVALFVLPFTFSMSETKGKMDKYKEVTKILKHITRHSEETKGIRVENLIGFAQVPLGLAGPLQIHGHYQKASIVAPIATVEAALVATVNRGCKAFQVGGGVHAFAMSGGMGRAPVCYFPSIDDAVTFYKRLPSLKEQSRKDAEAASRFASLLRITPHIIGSTVQVHFEYETGDAAGQNMTEFATVTACEKLLTSDLGKELKIIKINVEGDMAPDKMAAAAKAVRHPCGVQVMAWGTLSRHACQEVLRCHPAELYQALQSSKERDIRNALEGSSVNVSNVIAAMFIACGSCFQICPPPLPRHSGRHRLTVVYVFS